MIRMKRLAGGVALTALACAMSSAVYAQETTSAVRGVVTANGEAIDKAAITAVHTPSGTRASTASSAGGNFDLRGLRVGGPYTLTVTAPGYTPKVYKNVFLQVGQSYDLSVDVAEVEELIVTGSGARNNEQGPKTVLGQQDIQSVVTINRDPRDLARRDMLVAQDLSGGRAGTNSGGVSIAGSNPRYNRIAVDGVAAQDNFGLAQGGMSTARGPVTIDAVEQFSVAAVPTDVQNGDFVGGALNLVLRSGGNSFHGVLFDNYLNDGLVGDRSEDTNIRQAIRQKNYGAFVSGPIIRDRLFFALSYENYETVDSTLFGVAGSGAGTSFSNNTSQAQIDNVVSIFNNRYASKFDVGAISPVKPVTDKKYSAKLDWNITDNHRASLTYRYAESSSVQRTDLGAATVALDSHWYTQFNSDEAYTFELNSHWSDNLTTFIKATYRDYNNQQMPPSGQNYSDVSVCLAPTSDATLTSCASGFNTVRWGPDQFRHANALREQEYRYQAQAEYILDEHTFKVGVQARKALPYDIFVPNSRGQYYFDSVADFQAGRASRLIYQNAITGDPNDAAYDSPYWTYTIYGQDTVQVTDTLKVAAGVRIDTYHEDDKPILNPNFTARNGFSNQGTIDGLKMVMPRVSAEWKPQDNLRFSAGFGLFSGGTPDVLTGAPFYNTGYATSQVDIQRTATGFTEAGGTPGFSSAVGSAGLDNLLADSKFGYAIPSPVIALQQGTISGTPTIPALNEVIALAPNFQLPSQWKLFLSGTWRFGDGWALNADVVATQVRDEITYYDSRAQVLVVNGQQQLLPDGRIRYDGLGTVPGKTSVNLQANRDIIVGNTDKGHSYTASVSLTKSWDWGGDLLLGYARQEMKDTGGGVYFGTTAGSLYGGVMAGMDPNSDYLGRSVYEIPNRFKLEFGYHKAFFGDNETRITLFAERQDGRPFGFAMQDRASGRSPVFGVNRTAQLLYVPDFAGDANPNDLNVGLVTFATQADLNNFKRYVDNFELPNGQLVEKYSKNNAPINRLDLQLSQELPSPIQGHKFKVNLDIRNVLNLLNADWGRVAEYSDITTLTRVDCADANGAAVPTTSAACPRYRYSQVPTSVSKTVNTPLSLWYIQVGLRYEF